MLPALDIVSLGGSGGFGMNAMVLRCEGSGLLIDFGIGFPHEGLPGIERLVPNAAPIAERMANLDAIILTHGHDDHVGGLPFLPRTWARAPVYGTPLTIALARDRCAGAVPSPLDFRVVEPGTEIGCGRFRIRFVHVTHSIPQSCALEISSPAGTIVHTGDFKLDRSPIVGPLTDLPQLERIARAGVRLLILDSTGARRPGRTLSERDLIPGLDGWVESAPGQVFVSTFSSQLHRIQTLIDIARRRGRRVALIGRRLRQTVIHARDLGLLDVVDGTLVRAEDLVKQAAHRRLWLIGGCQGELDSALARVSFARDSRAAIDPGDRVVVSASIIPGNGLLVARMLDRFDRLGAQTVHADDEPGLHASGHGSRDDLGELVGLLSPEVALPVHGDRRHLRAASDLARDRVGSVAPLAERGEWLQLTDDGVTRGETIDLPPLHVDAANRIVLPGLVAERRRLAGAGIAIIALPRSGRAWGATSGPAGARVLARGIPGWEGPDGLAPLVERTVERTLAGLPESAPAGRVRDAIVERVSPLLRGISRRHRPEIVVLTGPLDED